MTTRAWAPAPPAEVDLRPSALRSQLVELAVSAARIGTWDWDLAARRLEWDDQLLELFGLHPSTFDGTTASVLARVHPDDAARVRAELRAAIASCGEHVDEFRVLAPAAGSPGAAAGGAAPGAQVRWIATRGQVLCDEDGRPVRVLGAAWDVSARRDAQVSAEQVSAQSDLVDHVAAAMVDALDPDEAVATLARLVVPALADSAVVTLVDDDRTSGQRESLSATSGWHVDPALREVAQAYARSRLDALSDDSLLVRALATGRPQQLDRRELAAAERMVEPGPVRELLTRLAPASVVVLPLPGRTGAVGLLTLANGAERGPLTALDLGRAEQVAQRAGVVLDNARLYRQQRALAEELQRALLTAPREPDHLDVVVRYLPAAQAAQVGGDWYDAFVTADGVTSLVIGDVTGHDRGAAATMGSLRNLLRGIGYTVGDQPALVLSALDRAVDGLEVGALATVVLAQVEQTEAERRAGLRTLRWSNAGHPPPLLLLPDGRVQVLDTPPDLLLGLDATTPRTDHAVTLPAGSTVLLYTDGLVERRDTDLSTSIAALAGAVRERAHLPLAALCDELLALLPADPDDDVAIVAVRARPEGPPASAA